MGRVTDDEIARLDWHKGVLPPGPYRVEWPAEQGGAFTLWGRQGTPPDFKDGWAIPLVASGVDTAMYALRDMLNAETLDEAWAAAEAALPEGWRGPVLRRSSIVVGQYQAQVFNPDGADLYEYADTPAAALLALAAALRAVPA